MNHNLYVAATQGKLDELVSYNYADLVSQTTPNGNTVLHVACQFGQLQFVNQIFDKCDPFQLQNQLRRTNNELETPLHLATRSGARFIVETILSKLNTGEILRAVNKDGDTALHMAVRLVGNQEIVTMLVQADPDFRYLPNKAGETPFYIAAERDDLTKLSVILDNSKSLDHSGPSGKTILHAAAVSSNSDFGCFPKLLAYNPALIYTKDEFGWTPLHYAVFEGNTSFVRNILEADKAAGYVVTKEDEKQTAFHIACARGFVDTMSVILEHCPDIWEMVDASEKNVLHIAFENEKENSVRFIVEQSWWKHLVNQKDDEGNTPFHLIYLNNEDIFIPFMPLLALLAVSSRVDYVINHKGLSAQDVARVFFKQISDSKRFPYVMGRNIVRDQSEEMSLLGRQHLESPKIRTEKGVIKSEVFKKMGDTLLIIAALVATVAFAAIFTLPGGYDAKGTPILLRKKAFQLFVLSDMFAMVFSVSALLIYIRAPFLWNKFISIYYQKAMVFTFSGVMAMLVSFLTGAYLVLPKDIAIFTVCLGSILLLFNVLGREAKIIFQNYSKQKFFRTVL